MSQLISIKSVQDIPVTYRETPIEKLLKYQNLKQESTVYPKAELLIGTCVDHRIQLHLPKNFAYMVRAGGANMKYSEFKISYAIAIAGIKHIALIGHNQCGMSNLNSKKNEFINGLVHHAGWNSEEAESFFIKHAPDFEVGNEQHFTLKETRRLRKKYPDIIIAPMMYLVEDNLLYFINEK